MADRILSSLDEVRQVLACVRFAPSCVDMGWTWEVKATFEFVAFDTTDPAGYLLRTTFRRPDRDTGEVSTGYGRWWHIPDKVTESGVVKTAFAAAKMILEHELMEAFRFNDIRLFDPHHDLEALKRAANPYPDSKWQGISKFAEPNVPVVHGTGLSEVTAVMVGGRRFILDDTKKHPGGLTAEQLVVACRNIGFDLTCGACAMQFYTGYAGPTSRHDMLPPDHTCAKATNGVVPLPAAMPLGAIRVLSNGAKGIVEEDERGRYVRWGTCAHCPVATEGPSRGEKRPWLCDNYDRPDHKLRAPCGVS